MPVTQTLFNNTRIAPTPSGYLHLGNVLSFAVTAAIAKQSDTRVLLRIDDMDQARVNKLYVQDIFDTLNFLEIPWDKGPQTVHDFEENYSQRHRMPLYHTALEQLAANGLVFACTCSRSQLQSGAGCPCFDKKIPLATANACWRLLTDNQKEIKVKNYPGNIIGAHLPAEMENFVVQKKDGCPAYQLTSVVDDIFYGVDLIVRGQDLWPSTLAQQQLATLLNFSQFNAVTFCHHVLLTGASGNKLSKSAGATSVKYLRESGKKPAAIFALIAAMCGVKQPVGNWQQLADSVLKF